MQYYYHDRDVAISAQDRQGLRFPTSGCGTNPQCVGLLSPLYLAAALAPIMYCFDTTISSCGTNPIYLGTTSSGCGILAQNIYCHHYFHMRP